MQMLYGAHDANVRPISELLHMYLLSKKRTGDKKTEALPKTCGPKAPRCAASSRADALHLRANLVACGYHIFLLVRSDHCVGVHRGIALH